MKIILEKDDFTAQPVVFQDLQEGIYYNLTCPEIMILCDSCKCNISESTKIIADCGEYCPSCFGQLQQFPESYNVVSCLDILLFQDGWRAIEQLMMMEGIEKFGYDWQAIANYINTEKDPDEISKHYQQLYLNSKDHVPSYVVDQIIRVVDVDYKSYFSEDPIINYLTTTDLTQNLDTSTEKKRKIRRRRPRMVFTNRRQARHQTTALQIKGYFPKRQQFEQQFDDEAQILLADLQFQEADTPEITQLKFEIIKIYNKRLQQRNQIKDFISRKKLLDLQYQMARQSQKSQIEKQIQGMMKLFERFNLRQDHEKLIAGIAKKLQFQERIKELKEMKRKGIKKLQVNVKISQKEKETDYWDVEQILKLGKTRHNQVSSSIQPLKLKQASRGSMDKDQLYFCQKLQINPVCYILIKQTIIRQCILRKQTAKVWLYSIIKLPQAKIDNICSFITKKIPKLKIVDPPFLQAS